MVVREGGGEPPGGGGLPLGVPPPPPPPPPPKLPSVILVPITDCDKKLTFHWCMCSQKPSEAVSEVVNFPGEGYPQITLF